ncbi:AADAT (predicted) [Pycnogonum litorale]
MATNRVPVNYKRFLSRIAEARKPTILRELVAKFPLNLPGVINLSIGFPHSSKIPIRDCNMSLTDGSTLSIGAGECTSALQYGMTRGDPELVEWLRKFQLMIHTPPTATLKPDEGKLELLVSPGGQFMVTEIFGTVMNPGDYIIVEEYTYSAMVTYLNSIRAKYIIVENDEYGMKPSSLGEKLSRWNPKDCKDNVDGSAVPKLMYIVPSCGNPTGLTLSAERRKEIYEISREYNLLIVEDDPYYFLESETLPSFLSLDVDGRVLRIDSFSKIIAPGLRVGFLSGPKPIVDNVMLSSQVTVQHCSGWSQRTLFKILEHWGSDRFLDHLKDVREFYIGQIEMVVECAEEFLTGFVEWHTPTGGMFLWMKILGVEDSTDVVEELTAKGIVFAPGQGFSSRVDKPSPYIRICFSTATRVKIQKAFECLAEVLRTDLK